MFGRVSQDRQRCRATLWQQAGYQAHDRPGVSRERRHTYARKLRIDPGLGLSSRLAYARRMSRSLNALCDHYEKLCGPRPETGQ
ncbi:DUF6415 family natural product biosynthesis protein [Streptomyces sp. NPDC047042]|uniref:DUF6415 family natural product biosynthesis protein n=1 Tax=Streptomyces sp. NPDC047042 TaxID=3154807 RepID=UPI0033D2D2B4